jgi:hypothetical protein
MQYNITTKSDLIGIVQSAIEQQKWEAAIKLIETIKEMERKGRDTILLEIRDAPSNL